MKNDKGFRKHIYNLRVGTKLTLLICVTCSLMLIFELFIRESVYNTYNEQIYSQTAQTLNLCINHLEMEFKQQELLTLSVIGDEQIQRNLSAIRRNPSDLNVEERRNIESAVSNYQRTLDANYALAIRLKNGKLLGRTEGFINKELYESAVVTAENKSGALVCSFYGNDIVFLREIREIEEMSMENLGTILLRVPFSHMMKGLDIYRDGEKKNAHVTIFEEGKQLFSTAEDPFLLEEKNGWDIADDFFIVQRYSKSTGWIFQIRIPFEEVAVAVKKANSNSVMIMCVVACLIIGCGAFIIFSIMRHIKVLISRFEEYGKGLDIDKGIAESYKDRHDEIGELHNRFSAMVIQHKKITEEYYNSMLLLKEAQFSQLQVQMQPHFLYNALSSITWLAYENGDHAVAKMSEKLGKLLRRTVRNDKKIVTVREELETVRDYLHIQTFRYSERLSARIDCPEELLDVAIPTMTLQPLVENAIFYVVENTLEPCTINIFGTVANDAAEICVEDNGGSIDEQIIQKLKDGKTVAKGNGVGLANIDQRIKYLFSDRYGLKIFCEEGCSRVVVRLPYSRRDSTGSLEGRADENSHVGR